MSGTESDDTEVETSIEKVENIDYIELNYNSRYIKSSKQTTSTNTESGV